MGVSCFSFHFSDAINVCLTVFFIRRSSKKTPVLVCSVWCVRADGRPCRHAGQSGVNVRRKKKL